MIINKFPERARWFRCKDGTAVMVVNYGAYFLIMFSREESGLVSKEWGTDACIITSEIGPVDWPDPELPPVDLSGWEVGVEHLVTCRDGKRRIAVRADNPPGCIWHVHMAVRGEADYCLRLNGRVARSDRKPDAHDIIADFGPLDELDLEGKG